jgi:tRNA-dihydrouridine synthase 1
MCRKYGAQLVYTPMMIASQFVASPEYRARELQTTPFDRPLVCHFAANTPREFAAAAKLAEPHCDAIDLNLGCPQRTAYVGHFGSYLLEDEDRDLVVSIVKAGVEAVKVPIFCKIRLLETYERTAELCRQLYEAGASLIAVHARYRASFHRKGPGARDGPAMLDQVQKLKQEFSAGKYSNRLLVTNGNTITYEDVVKNLETTKADGIMSAEGILDDPALYLGRLGSREEAEKNDIVVEVKGGKVFDEWPKRDKWMKKMAFIKQVEAKIQKDGKDSLNRKEKKKLLKKEKLLSKLKNCSKNGSTTFPLRKLYEAADDSVGLALEYLELVRQFPAVMRTVIFHTRRIAKQELTKYQLMEECLACTSVDEVERVLNKIRIYQQNPELFVFDIEKSKTEKEALERKKIEESKRKAYEARMVRKAKREGKTDLEFYLRQGAAVPTLETVEEMKSLSKEEQMKLWKDRDHSQHCMAFHLSGECPRGRGCAFLHVASHTKNSFVESDEVAG